MKKSSVKEIFLRYFILLAIVLVNSLTSIFYSILLPLTIYPLSFILSLFYKTIVIGNTLVIGSISIEIIPACVAISAFLLLIILNLITPMRIKTRIYSLIFSITVLLLANVLRIFILTILLINQSVMFDIIHKIFWYFLSIILVIIIWFLTAYIFKLKSIPLYTDIKTILNQNTKNNDKKTEKRTNKRKRKRTKK